MPTKYIKADLDMVIPYEEIETEAFSPTMNLRWQKGRLQQMWQSDKGSAYWQEVPGAPDDSTHED